MSAYTDAMAAAFAVMVAQWGTSLVYPEGTGYAEYLSPSGAEYLSPDGSNYVARITGATIDGIHTPLSLSFSMQLSGYQRKADTAFDALRSDVVSAGLYAPVTARMPAVTRPNVSVDGQSFLVLDVKDDIPSDPTVKLILSALQ